MSKYCAFTVDPCNVISIAETGSPDGEEVCVTYNLFDNADKQIGQSEATFAVKNSLLFCSHNLVDYIKSANIKPSDAYSIKAEFCMYGVTHTAAATLCWQRLLHNSWKTNEDLNKIASGLDDKTIFKKDGANNDNDCVRLIKENLETLKLLTEKQTKDEKGYGDNTHKAVLSFQKEYKLQDCPEGKRSELHKFERTLGNDGMVGRQTLLALDEALMNGWKRKGLIHESWSNNETLNKIAKGSAKAPNDKTSFKLNDKDDNIKTIQENLKKIGLLKYPKEATHYFGNITEKNIKIFKVSYDPEKAKEKIHDGIDRKAWKEKTTKKNAIDGVVDAQTLLAMDEALVNGWKCSDVKAEYFPLATAPHETKDLPAGKNNTWERGQRQFGWRRDGGKRAHAGCDLYGTEGDPIFAIKAGVVTHSDNAFHSGTGVVVIDHGDYTIRYAEIKQGSKLVEKGDCVIAGQKIAKMGHIKGVEPMLHFEQYDNSLDGRLTDGKNATFKHSSNGLPYYRRLDLKNPTELLNTLFKKPLPKETKI